jgi:hypothetical protein
MIKRLQMLLGMRGSVECFYDKRYVAVDSVPTAIE